MPAITRLCDRVILINEGKLLQDGPSHKVVSNYLIAGTNTIALREWPDPKKVPGKDVARLRAVRVYAEDGRITDVVDIRKPVAIGMEYDVIKAGFVIHITDLYFQCLYILRKNA